MAFSMLKFAMLHTILGSEVTEYPACGKEPFGVASLTLSNPQEKTKKWKDKNSTETFLCL